MNIPKYKIVLCTPALYSVGGVERVVAVKANYFADQLGYDVTIIVSEGNGLSSYFAVSKQVHIVNFYLGFEELWKLYPRKEGKKDAYKAYKKAIKEGTTNEQIRQGIENYKAWLKAKNETTYIKQGSTFFNGEHWNDEFDLTQINRGDPFDVRNQYWDETDPTVH